MLIRKEEVNKGKKLKFDVGKILAIFFMVIIHVHDNIGILDYSCMPSKGYNLFLEFIGAPMTVPMFMFATRMGMVYIKHDSSVDFAR